MNISTARYAVVGMGAFVLLGTLVGCTAQAEPAPGEDEENVTQTEDAITAQPIGGGTSGGTVKTCTRYCSTRYCSMDPCPPGDLCLIRCSTVTVCCQYAQ